MKRRQMLALAGSACLLNLANKGTAMASTASPADTAGITAAIHAYETAWNAGDLDAMEALYSPDVHWVNVRGMHWRGLAEVDRAHRVYFDLMFRGVHNDLEAIESITPVAPGVAVAVVVWRFGAFTTPDGQKLPPGRTRMSIVYVAMSGGWKIAHGHNEDIDEHAQQFDPIRGSARKA